MAYADQQMSGNRITALIIVALIHIALGYALVTGLAYSAFKKVKDQVTAVDIKEEEKKEEPPPPPPDKPVTPPPPVAPVPPISINNSAPKIETVTQIPPPAPIVIAAPAAPPAPPPPAFQPKGAAPKGNPGNWVTTNDYPSSALRAEAEGTTRFRLSVGPDGKVTDCQVTGSSGTPSLDDAACANLRRRARFNPATDGNGQPTSGSYSSQVRWQIPKD